MADSNEKNLRNMATTLLNMLRSTSDPTAQRLNPPSVVPGHSLARTAPGQATRVQGHGETPSCSTSIQHDMARSFPALFNKKKGKGIKRPGAKTTSITFILLNKPMEKTPNVSEEMTLLQGGLGKKLIPIPHDANHMEISDILCESYPKLKDLEGAWLIHKASGGAGIRKLNLVTPEDVGYTGTSLSKTWGGRGYLYIMPIQQELDTTPLPFTSKEFLGMPKARCSSCLELIPLQLLTIHVQTCKTMSETNETDDEVTILEDDRSEPKSPVGPDQNVSCPMCDEEFPEDSIQMHASTCGDEDCKSVVLAASKCPSHFSSTSDIIKSLEDRVDHSKTFNINVTRDDLYQRGLKQWARQKQSSPKNRLLVSFIGEQGIDDGALRREFLTEMIRGLELHLFEGDAHQGKNPKYSISNLQENIFKICGEIIATSLAQGGPAPNFFSTWSYHFLCHGKMLVTDVPEVTDVEIQNLIEQVESAEGDKLTEYCDAIIACGYTGPINNDHKKAITDAIRLHSVMRLIPMLSQLREGLSIYGLDDLLSQHHQALQQVFLPGNLKQVDADFMVKALSPQYSEKGSLRHRKEVTIINFFQDLLQNLEDQAGDLGGSPSAESGPKQLSLEKLCQWISGQAHVPLVETEQDSFKITVNFDHDCTSRYGPHTICFPTVSACAMSITMPTQHMTSYAEFEDLICQAVCDGFQFTKH
ncbi:G2/M phase-specific E3 ubiquitin-protein ligase [Oryzias melastigma]|uniref:G2/M phase-specific E3 ubiquitin-protein ligase-like n=1 Tax=Oryzias melastigma TaxID=30732 RepID=A0A3B3BZ32_ORYME|nr:G2/M phase-specific E3 ubiquitin-protein ligase [Oryzias melastigma]XP_024113644.1 G2/M phase-specific E3 ubiquitin-protein ligase [Oryzias melastigma]